MDKLAKLENISKAFLNPNGGADIMSVRRLGKLFVANNLDASLFMDLLVAFERDVNNKPIRIWEELIDYSRKKNPYNHTNYINITYNNLCSYINGWSN